MPTLIGSLTEPSRFSNACVSSHPLLLLAQLLILVELGEIRGCLTHRNRLPFMNPYLQKTEAARQQVALFQFPTMQDASGRVWRGCRYHVMYTQWFLGYFLYKICGVAGDLEEYSMDTWWGFEIQMATDKDHCDDLEQPLPSTEIKAWLALNYGHLVADDYEYLTNILWLGKTPDGNTVHYIRNYYSWQQAFNWLTEQKTRAVASGRAVIPSVATPSTFTDINPWAPLLVGPLKLDEFYKYLEACGLLTSDGKFTPLGQGDGLGKARKAPWVGAMLALTEAKLLDDNKAAISRALLAPAGKAQVKLADNSLLNPSRKAETYQQAAKKVLRERGYLRN